MLTRTKAALVATCVSVVSSNFARADTTTFECDYKTYGDDKGLHKVKAPFRLTFLIDTSARKAYIIGNVGSSEVSLVPNADGLTLVEITGSGNVMTTAITSKGKSVHSRGSIMSGDLIPSQYYGSCQKK
jgi:hypothetical protein